MRTRQQQRLQTSWESCWSKGTCDDFFFFFSSSIGSSRGRSGRQFICTEQSGGLCRRQFRHFREQHWFLSSRQIFPPFIHLQARTLASALPPAPSRIVVGAARSLASCRSSQDTCARAALLSSRVSFAAQTRAWHRSTLADCRLRAH